VRFVLCIGTRDRGCSVHPAFPAPSDFEGGMFAANLARIMRRECEAVFAETAGLSSFETRLTPLLRMRSWTSTGPQNLMVRSAATPRVSNHESHDSRMI
jgi:hypothetical protein